jgi:CspA family cold shock protein
MDGYRKLEEGQQVEFSIESGPRGLQAAEVEVV